MSKVNKQGQTLEQFLQQYDYKEYDRPSYCADVMVFSIHENKPVVLLIKRGNHPHIGELALCGGFVEMGESAEECAKRELAEETGLVGVELDQLVTVSTPSRDVRGWTVSTVFMGVINSPEDVAGGDDADFAGWYYVDFVASGNSYALKLQNIDSGETNEAALDVVRSDSGRIDLNKTTVRVRGELAFDHAKIILYALEKL